MTNAFTWNDGTPSVLANDRAARGTKGGKSYSQGATEAVARKTKRTGKNPGTIANLSKRAEKVLENRWGGSVSRAGSAKA